MVASDGPGLRSGSTTSVVSGMAPGASDGPGLWPWWPVMVLVQGHEQCLLDEPSDNQMV